MVRLEGLEPPRLAAPEPKSGASTNFATAARFECLYPTFAIKCQYKQKIKMGRLTGFEPATTRITTEGSTAELQSPQFIWLLMP